MGQSAFTAIKVLICIQRCCISNQNLVAIVQHCAISDFMLIDENSMFALHIIRVIFVCSFVEPYPQVLSRD